MKRKKAETLRGYFRAICLLVLLASFAPAGGHAYVMPAEQLLGFMVENFSKLRTLVITQLTVVMTPWENGEETSFLEKVWVKADGFAYSEIVPQSEDESGKAQRPAWDRPKPDLLFRQVLMARKREAIMGMLSEMGLNMEDVGFTRVRGVVAYRIGEKDPESPKLLIEKERFLPLLLSYRPPEDFRQRMVTVEFQEYKKLSEGWYPYRISYSIGDETMERYEVHDLKVNLPIDPSRFVRPIEEPKPTGSTGEAAQSWEEKRLREVIELLKEKFR